MKKANIHSHDDLASAIDTTYKRLKERVEKNIDLDAEMKVATVASRLRLHELISALRSLIDLPPSRPPAIFGMPLN